MRLHLLDDDIPKAYALELACQLVDFTEGVDDPAITESAVDVLLWATQLARAKEAVGDNDTASGAQEAVRFPKKRGFVRAVSIATALKCVDSVERGRGKRRVFVVAENQPDALGFRAGLV